MAPVLRRRFFESRGGPSFFSLKSYTLQRREKESSLSQVLATIEVGTKTHEEGPLLNGPGPKRSAPYFKYGPPNDEVRWWPLCKVYIRLCAIGLEIDTNQSEIS